MALPHAPLADRHPLDLDLDALAGAIRGRVVRPGHEDYDALRRVRNAVVDAQPLAVIQAADSADVALVVDVARETGLELAVRGGGHSLAGHGTVDGGLVLDLSGLRGLHIDPERRLAWAQAGLTAGEYTAAAAAHGLATPFGDTGSVGIAGLTLGGGIGWLARKHGLAIDALVAAEVVTADGAVVTASADEHPDLFWAIRGGGGNFGVVTRFVYRLYPVETILGGALFLPPTREALLGLVPVAKAAPEELTTISMLMPAPPMPFVPAEQHGKPTLVVMFVWAGDPEAGQAALEPFRQLAQPVAEAVMPMPYPGIYELTKGPDGPSKEAFRSMFRDDLDAAAVDAILEATSRPGAPSGMVQIRVLGGAMGEVAVDATAFAHREREVLVAIITPFEDDGAAAEAWTRALFERLLDGAAGVYSNFLVTEGDERVREAYPGGTFTRLAGIKRRYDPLNLFHRNQNIRPAGPAA